MTPPTVTCAMASSILTLSLAASSGLLASSSAFISSYVLPWRHFSSFQPRKLHVKLTGSSPCLMIIKHVSSTDRPVTSVPSATYFLAISMASLRSLSHKRIILMKRLERGGQLSEDDKHEIFFEFMKDRKHLLHNLNENMSAGGFNVGGAILSRIAKNIHKANVLILDTLIDKIEKGNYDGLSEMTSDLKITTPDDDEWEFSLGDKVVVDLPKGKFKSLQKQTVGWTKKLNNVHKQYGYVTGLKNKYDCKIEVYFHEILTSTSLYAGVLDKTDVEFRSVPSRWKVGDFVRTKKSKELVKKFQKRLPDIPDKFIGKQGKVIAVTSAGVFVTFNGTSSYAINPPLLQKVENPGPLFRKEPITDHPKRLRVGMKVKVIKDLTTLIKNQKGFGGWNWKMTPMAGNFVRISHIRKDGSLIVRMKVGRPWRLNFESVYHGDYERFEPPSDLPFLPGDIVRLKLSGNIRMHLLSAQVLESCTDFLKLPGEVVGIDDDFDAVVRFTNGKKQILNPSLLQKVSNSRAEQFKVNEARKISLQAGCRVKISPGPVGYIQDILSRIKPDPLTSEAILSDAELEGYVDDEHAVIRYGDSRRIRINKKFLYPTEGDECDTSRKVNFHDLKSIVEVIESCVAMANVQSNSDDVDGSVDIFSVSSGSPPTVCLRINSTATPQMVTHYLKDISGWEIPVGCENECCIKMDGIMDVDIVLLTREEEKPVEQISSLEGAIGEGTSEERKHPPIQREISKSASTPEQIVDSGVRDVRVAANNPASIPGFQDTKFLTLPIAGGSFYFHYVPNTVHTSVDYSATAGDQVRQSNVTNINIISQDRYGRINIDKNN